MTRASFSSSSLLLRRRNLLAATIILSGCLGVGFGVVKATDAQPTAPRSTGLQGFADIVQPLLPAVVNIRTMNDNTADRRGYEMPEPPFDLSLPELLRRYFEESLNNRPRKTYSLGSGFIIDAEGYVVTSNHVIADSDDITVILNNENKTELKAKIVGRDRRTDLALLKISTDEKLPFLSWGDSNTARVGDWVIAIGNPFGLSSTVTVGIISTIARDISRSSAESGVDYVAGWLQTDAAINVGNSGGPMSNVSGQVIGVSTAIMSPSGGSVGIGFAIPSAVAKPVIEQLKKFGRTHRGWLGVKIQPVTKEIAQALKLMKAEGALVSSLTPNGPAAKAGFKPGDVILEFNGKPVKEVRYLPHIVGETKSGEKVSVIVWRNGQKTTLTVTVGEFEQAEAEGLLSPESEERPLASASLQEVLGLSLRALQPRDREELGLPATLQGVLIVRIDPSSQAADAGRLYRGDVITNVATGVKNTPVATPQDIQREIDKARKENLSSILLYISRGREQQFVPLSIIARETPKKKLQGKKE